MKRLMVASATPAGLGCHSGWSARLLTAGLPAVPLTFMRASLAETTIQAKAALSSHASHAGAALASAGKGS